MVAGRDEDALAAVRAAQTRLSAFADAPTCGSRL